MFKNYSSKDNDNAFVESFFKTLKTELPKLVFKNIEDAREAIFEYIEG